MSPRLQSATIKNNSMKESTTSTSILTQQVKNQQSQPVRSRGWTPLKYPKSALFITSSSSTEIVEDRTIELNNFFPLHRDILLATTRELLLLNGNADAKTMAVKKSLDLGTTEKSTMILPISTDENPDRISEEEDEEPFTNQTKRVSNRIKSRKRKTKVAEKPPTTKTAKRRKVVRTSAEDLANSLLDQVKASLSSSDDTKSSIHQSFSATNASGISSLSGLNLTDLSANILDGSTTPLPRPPRKISVSSEFDQDLTDDEIKMKHEFVDADICSYMNYAEKISKNGFVNLLQSIQEIPPMLQTSISSEAILREKALQVVTLLVQSFSDDALRLFMGYKAHGIARNRIICMMAGFLFDASHALFAWDQTEQEMADTDSDIMKRGEEFSLDEYIQKTLFDSRALNKVGGFHPSSLLPHAISIGRLRRRNISWTKFSATAQGKKMLRHHVRGESEILTVGKRRRGQRLRQRHWLTTSLLWNSNEQTTIDEVTDEGESCVAAPTASTGTTEQRSRSCSFASSTDAGENNNYFMEQSLSSQRQAKLLAEMPNAVRLTLGRNTGESWGVGLVRESVMCVVGKVGTSAGQPTKLECGDLILHIENERGEEASAPTCAWVAGDDQDWYRDMVNLFKTSDELHLIVQRVGGGGGAGL